MKKLFLISILCIFLMFIASADLGIFKQNECMQLKTVLNTSEVTLLSVQYPNGTSQFINSTMTKQGNSFNYTFCSTSSDGKYIYDYCDAVGNCYVNSFEVNPLGKSLSTAEATTYIIILIISLIVFVGLLLIGIYLPIGNKKDEMTGYILAINNLKYLKLVCLGFAYLTALVIAYFAYTLSYAYLDFQFMTNLFRILFYAEAIAVLPLFILFTYLTITNLIRDTKVKDALMRGLRTR